MKEKGGECSWRGSRAEGGEEVEQAKEERVLQRGNPDSDAAVVLLWKGDVCGLGGYSSDAEAL